MTSLTNLNDFMAVNSVIPGWCNVRPCRHRWQEASHCKIQVFRNIQSYKCLIVALTIVSKTKEGNHLGAMIRVIYL